MFPWDAVQITDVVTIIILCSQFETQFKIKFYWHFYSSLNWNLLKENVIIWLLSDNRNLGSDHV